MGRLRMEQQPEIPKQRVYFLRANTEMYFDISPLALSFDHCAYLAEKRYYFRAGEYFSQQDTTTPDSRNESTPSADTSVSAETLQLQPSLRFYTGSRKLYARYEQYSVARRKQQRQSHMDSRTDFYSLRYS